MKKIGFVLAATVILFSCQTADKKTTGTLSAEQKIMATMDSANFTNIQWLDSTYKDLGKIKEGQVVEVSYRFKNTGDKNLIIADVKAQCGCTLPEKPGQPFAPGEIGTIRAKFDSKSKQGAVRKEIYVTANTTPRTESTLVFSVEITN